MYNFFIEQENFIGETVSISGADFNHIKNVLRMQIGDEFLVSYNSASHLCTIKEFTDNSVIANITQMNYQDTSLPVEITLFQGLPKSDKMELIIQKAVELGAKNIVPVQMERCIVKIEDKKKDAKTARWQAIAESAAKQSKRTLIPTVKDAVNYKNLLKEIDSFDLFIVPYENERGIKSTIDALNAIKSGMKIGILIGPEGGFSDTEIQLLDGTKATTVSLGKRILRTETAAITALATLMMHIEMNL